MAISPNDTSCQDHLTVFFLSTILFVNPITKNEVIQISYSLRNSNSVGFDNLGTKLMNKNYIPYCTASSIYT